MNGFLRLCGGDKGENYRQVIRTHQIFTTTYCACSAKGSGLDRNQTRPPRGSLTFSGGDKSIGDY